MMAKASTVFQTGGRTGASIWNRSWGRARGRRDFVFSASTGLVARSADRVGNFGDCRTALGRTGEGFCPYAIKPKFLHELPIQIPTANTSTPPTTTWNAADSNGVSMWRFLIQAIVAN